MQIAPVNIPPTPAGAQPPQTIVNVLPEVQAQAVPPVTVDAVRPPPKSEKKQKTRQHRGDNTEGDEREPPDDPRRGHNVNISV